MAYLQRLWDMLKLVLSGSKGKATIQCVVDAFNVFGQAQTDRLLSIARMKALEMEKKYPGVGMGNLKREEVLQYLTDEAKRFGYEVAGTASKHVLSLVLELAVSALKKEDLL
jgi:hypothetical protein